MNRTLSSNLISESVKRLRMNIFIKVVDVTPLLGPWWILRRVLLSDWQKFLRCIQFGAFREKLEEHHPRGHTLLRGMCGRRRHLVCSRARCPLVTTGKWPAPFKLMRLKRISFIITLQTTTIFYSPIPFQLFGGPFKRTLGYRNVIEATFSAHQRKLLNHFANSISIKQDPNCSTSSAVFGTILVDLAKNDQRDYIVCGGVTKTTLNNIRKLHLMLHMVQTLTRQHWFHDIMFTGSSLVYKSPDISSIPIEEPILRVYI